MRAWYRKLKILSGRLESGTLTLTGLVVLVDLSAKVDGGSETILWDIYSFLSDNIQSCMKFSCKFEKEHGFHQASISNCFLRLAIGANHYVCQYIVSALRVIMKDMKVFPI